MKGFQYFKLAEKLYTENNIFGKGTFKMNEITIKIIWDYLQIHHLRTENDYFLFGCKVEFDENLRIGEIKFN